MYTYLHSLSLLDALPYCFARLLNLVAVAGTTDKAVLWGFVSRYAPGANAATQPELDRLLGYALAYHRDFIAPTLKRRAPDAREAAALRKDRKSTRLNSSH